MRKALGWGLLAAGTVVLGIWARADHAPRIEAAVAAGATQVVAGAVHAVRADVSGRDITLSGLADTATERDTLIAGAEAVPGRRVVNASALEVLPTAQPYVTELSKVEGGAIMASGHVPSEVQRNALASELGGAEAALSLASGASGSWADLVQGAVRGLGPMIAGTALIEDDRLVLTGEVLGPDEHIAMLDALGSLAETADIDGVMLRDDGTPAIWQFDWSALFGGRLSGKLPRGMAPDAVRAALGAEELEIDGVTQALIGPAADLDLWAKVNSALPTLETLRLKGGPEGLDVLAGVARGVDLAEASANLSTLFGAGAALAVEMADPGAEEGAERRHAATGQRERLSGGFWLAIPSFVPSVETCTAEVGAVLDAATINFVSGSAELDRDALGVLNAIGSIVRECTTAGALKAEIGGHTDSSGTPEGNRRLSQLRASAVRLALIERGAPRLSLVSRGYGDAQPVADNETEEGKAKNRRTTIIWAE